MFGALEKMTGEDNVEELGRLTELLGKTGEDYSAETDKLKAADWKGVSERVRAQEALWKKDLERQKKLIHQVKQKVDALARLSRQSGQKKKIREAYGSSAEDVSVLSSQG